ncbi:amine sulfotransferase-like [Coregonus clupeaformis]|uniref:amine sulfotransferase-like n=1 Tax=Coregonus clupeaformis TaxID=59861 RepID=UPI001E1C6027|nr:amine sulfotransferase-like [Coregonus clupeaformis]
MAEEPPKFVPGLVSYKGLKLIKNVHEESYLQCSQKDLKGMIVMVSTFLKKSLDDKTLNMIVEKSTFSNIQQTQNANLNTVAPDLFGRSEGLMLLKGTIGDWKTLFTITQSGRFDRRMKGFPLEFLWDV